MMKLCALTILLSFSSQAWCAELEDFWTNDVLNRPFIASTRDNVSIADLGLPKEPTEAPLAVRTQGALAPQPNSELETADIGTRRSLDASGTETPSHPRGLDVKGFGSLPPLY